MSKLLIRRFWDRHLSRCARIGAIDWSVSAGPAQRAKPVSTGEPLMALEKLTRYYGAVRANDNVSFTARRSETLAIVCGAGCGKSTLVKIVMGLEGTTSGSIKLADLDLGSVPVSHRDRSLVRNLQMIFQNPFDTLNPSHTMGSQIRCVIKKLGGSKDDIERLVAAWLEMVTLPAEFADRRHSHCSGGQKQRICIARALASRPEIVVADEPVCPRCVVQVAVTQLLMDSSGETPPCWSSSAMTCSSSGTYRTGSSSGISGRLGRKAGRARSSLLRTIAILRHCRQ